MSDDRTHFELEVPARPDSVARVRTKLLGWLAHRADVPDPSTGAIALAVSEAVANSARHAYEDGRGSVGVSAILSPGRLDVCVEDSGKGFAPHADQRSNGLGMMIIVRLADEVTLHSDGAGTAVRLAFQLGTAADAGPLKRSGPRAITRVLGAQRLDAATR